MRVTDEVYLTETNYSRPENLTPGYFIIIIIIIIIIIVLACVHCSQGTFLWQSIYKLLGQLW